MRGKISERLRRVRVMLCGERGARKFARRADINYDTYIHYEKGTNIPATALANLAANCAINLYWLLMGEGEPLMPAGERVSESAHPYNAAPSQAVCPRCGYEFDIRQPLRGSRIMLCDPTAFAGGYRQSVLESLGARVMLCNSEEALGSLQERSDAAVVECWWPSGRDEGLRMAAIIRKRNLAERIVLVSSAEVQIDGDALKRAGADFYLVASPSREKFRGDILNAVLSPLPADKE